MGASVPGTLRRGISGHPGGKSVYKIRRGDAVQGASRTTTGSLQHTHQC